MFKAFPWSFPAFLELLTLLDSCNANCKYQVFLIYGILIKYQQLIKEVIFLVIAVCVVRVLASMLQTEKPSYSRVLECCNEAIKLCPDNAKTHYRRGVALYHLREFDEAILALQKAAKIQSKIGTVHIIDFYTFTYAFFISFYVMLKYSTCIHLN